LALYSSILREFQFDFFARLHLPVPRKLFDRLKSYFKEEFDVSMTDEDSEVTVTYTYLKKQQKQIKQTLSVGIHNRIIL